MKKILSFIAITLIVALAFPFSNCTSDDDDFNEAAYPSTLAESMMTRAAEVHNISVKDSVLYQYRIEMKRSVPATGSFKYEATVTVMFSHDSQGNPHVELLAYTSTADLCDVRNVSLKQVSLRTDYILCATGMDLKGYPSYGEYEYRFIL